MKMKGDDPMKRTLPLALVFVALLALSLRAVSPRSLAQVSSSVARYLFASSSDPANIREGQLYANTTSHAPKFYTGSAWKTLAFTDTITPGGSSGQLQYNSSGAFAGDSGLTVSGSGSPLDLTVGRGVSAKVFTSTPQALTDGATVTWNLNSGQYATVTLGGNRTLSITNTATGKSGGLIVTQDGTGNRTLALPGGSKVADGAAGAGTATTPAAASDILCALYVGSTGYFNLATNYN